MSLAYSKNAELREANKEQATVQRMLDENALMIKRITTLQNEQRVPEAMSLVQRLHTNLTYLASLSEQSRALLNELRDTDAQQANSQNVPPNTALPTQQTQEHLHPQQQPATQPQPPMSMAQAPQSQPQAMSMAMQHPQQPTVMTATAPMPASSMPGAAPTATVMSNGQQPANHGMPPQPQQGHNPAPAPAPQPHMYQPQAPPQHVMYAQPPQQGYAPPPPGYPQQQYYHPQQPMPANMTYQMPAAPPQPQQQMSMPQQAPPPASQPQ